MIGLYLRTGESVKVGMRLTDRKGESFVVAERMGPSYKYGAAPIKDTKGTIRLPSEYGAYCVTE